MKMPAPILVALLLSFIGASVSTMAWARSAPTKPSPSKANIAKTGGASNTADLFQPPAEQDMPEDEFGKVVKMGRDIFVDTKRYAGEFVGENSNLSCGNCHLDAGRLADSAPLWAAYVSYPSYRKKNKHVNSYAERLQGCFKYSMNGKAPPLGDPVLVALESYSYWLASGARIDPKLRGRGYPEVAKPAQDPDYARGETIYEQRCALCHGRDGSGQQDADGRTTFPALWGPHSFNWGAGMSSLKNASGFIKANMPLGLRGSLSDQEAWDVATFVDSHERPQDPRFTESVAATRAKFHDSADDLYGKTVNGHLLGEDNASGKHALGIKSGGGMIAVVAILVVLFLVLVGLWLFSPAFRALSGRPTPDSPPTGRSARRRR